MNERLFGKPQSILRGMFYMLLASCVFMTWMCVVGSGDLIVLMLRGRFVAAPATITKCYWAANRSGVTVDISYDYEFNGVLYTGTRLGPIATVSHSREAARAIDGYLASRRGIVKLDPENPKRSYLEIPRQYENLFSFGLFILIPTCLPLVFFVGYVIAFIRTHATSRDSNAAGGTGGLSTGA
jgi:hypothetical protein